jgi:FtsH-binding integral membrane protein
VPPQPAYQPPQPYTPPAAPFNSPPPQAELRRDATAGVSDRTRFIRLTYLHLFAAICVFAGLEFVLMKVDVVLVNVSAPILNFALGGQYNWGIVLLAFMVVGWVADYWASHSTSRPMQYLGLGLYVIAEALIFLPLLFLAEEQGRRFLYESGKELNIIRDAAILTLAIFGALTASVFITKKDFSFMRGALFMGGAAATVLVFLSIFMGFNLGIFFSFAMVILAAGYVLYYTSQVLAHYNPNQYVAASLALFSAVALMFWYVIRILMKLRE